MDLPPLSIRACTTRIPLVITLVVIALLGLVSQPASENADAHGLANRHIVVQHSGKCLDVIGFATSNGSPVGQWSCNGNSNQQWDIVQTADGYHNIKPKHVANKCLDVIGFATNDGASVGIWTCNGNDNQKFTFPCAGCWGDMRPKHVPGQTKCTDVLGFPVGDGGLVKIYGCNSLRNQQWFGDNHSPEKRLYTDRWYHFFEDSYNYQAWMTLTMNRRYECSGCATTWAPRVDGARDSWNATPNTVYLAEYPPQEWHDVHVHILDSPSNDLGWTNFHDEQGDACQTGDCDPNQSKPHTWWYVHVFVNNRTHTGQYGSWIQRQATVTHELGHAIVLDHDGLDISGCGLYNVPPTVMDYDCINGGLYAPQDWDSCGVNHAYYDPNWGWSGC